MKGFATGVLVLVALQVLGTSKGATGAGAGLEWASSAFRRLLAPDVPLIPDRTKKAAAKSTPPTSSGSPHDVGGMPQNPSVVYV